MLLFFACAKPVAPEAASEPAPVAIPEVGPQRDFAPPVPQVATLDNGATLWLVEDHELPIVSLAVVLPGGSTDDGGAWGRASLAADMLTEGAGDRDPLTFASDLRLLATDISAGVTRTRTIVSLDTHRDRLGETLPIFAEVVLEPRFDGEDWDRVLDRAVNLARQDREDGPVVASQYSRLSLYGAEHPLGPPVHGTPATLEGLEVDDASSWHQSRLVAGESTFVVVGDLSLDDARTMLDEQFASWPSETWTYREAQLDGERPGLGKVLLVDLPGSAQTAIRVTVPAYEPGADEAAAADLAGIVLGGSFTSRLNNLLREQKGYTYGARSWFSEGHLGTEFVAATNVRTDATADALTDLVGVLTGEAFTDDDRAKAASIARTDAIESVETRSGLNDALQDLVLRGVEPDGLQAELAAAGAVTLEQLNAARPWTQPDAGLVYLVGDHSVIGEPLAAAGFEVELVELPE